MPLEEVVASLRSMVYVEDPVAMGHERRRESIDTQGYLSANEKEMKQAYEILRREVKSKLHSDLLDFIVDCWAWNEAYHESGELWARFGDSRETQLVNLMVDKWRKGIRNNAMARFTLSDLRRGQKGPRADWFKHHYTIASELPNGDMAVYFTDDDLLREHGYPFDLTFHHPRPKKNFGRKVA